jgi:hypothetical protein
MQEVAVIEDSDDAGVKWKTRYYRVDEVYTRIYRPTYADKEKDKKVAQFDGLMRTAMDMLEPEVVGKDGSAVLEELLAKIGDCQQPLNSSVVFRKSGGKTTIGYSVKRRKAGIVGYQSAISGLIYISKTV